MLRSDEQSRRATVGVLVLVLTAALWSLNGPLIKQLQAEGVSGLSIACYRSLLAGVVFLPLALRRLRTLQRPAIGWRVGSVAAFTFMTACFVIATTKTAAANVIVLQYTSPIWVFLLSPLLLRERPRLGDGLVLVIAMVGVAILFAGAGGAETVWLIVALASGLGYGALTVTLRGLRAADPFAVATMNCLGSGLILAVAVGVWGTFRLTGCQFALLLALSLVQFAGPYVLFSWALQRVEAHRASLIVLLECVLNPLWTYLIIGEHVPRATLVGGPLILVSVAVWLLLTRRRAMRARVR